MRGLHRSFTQLLDGASDVAFHEALREIPVPRGKSSTLETAILMTKDLMGKRLGFYPPFIATKRNALTLAERSLPSRAVKRCSGTSQQPNPYKLFSQPHRAGHRHR